MSTVETTSPVLTPSKQTVDVADVPTVKKRASPSASSSRASKKQKVYTSVPRTRKGVMAMVQSWGYENPESASKCTIGGLARGAFKVDFDAKLDAVVWKGTCETCGKEAQATLRALLDQADNGHDYEEGSPRGGIVCTNQECGERWYLTNMCYKDPYLTCGKYHNHCSLCKGFGLCLADYRTAHCTVCGQHYFRGISGFSCQVCRGRREEEYILNSIPGYRETIEHNRRLDRSARGSRDREIQADGCTIS